MASLEAASTRLLQIQAASAPVTVTVDQVLPRNVFQRDVEGFATPHGPRAGAGGGGSVPKLGDRVVNLSHRMVSVAVLGLGLCLCLRLCACV